MKKVLLLTLFNCVSCGAQQLPLQPIPDEYLELIPRAAEIWMEEGFPDPSDCPLPDVFVSEDYALLNDFCGRCVSAYGNGCILACAKQDHGRHSTIALLNGYPYLFFHELGHTWEYCLDLPRNHLLGRVPPHTADQFNTYTRRVREEFFPEIH